MCGGCAVGARWVRNGPAPGVRCAGVLQVQVCDRYASVVVTCASNHTCELETSLEICDMARAKRCRRSRFRRSREASKVSSVFRRPSSRKY